jgi:hypothetical protein
VLDPFLRVYDDACDNVLVIQPAGERALVSIPNEYVQPSWSSERVKLLVDLDTLTDGEVEYQQAREHTHAMIDRSLFYLHPRFLDRLSTEEVVKLCAPEPRRIGDHLTHQYFNIWDSEAKMTAGLPGNRLLPYMKFILAARHSPAALKAAAVHTALSHNRLTDAVRAAAYTNFDFVSFSGIIIDSYSHRSHSYVNLFQPMGMTIKPKGRTREREFSPEEIHEIFARMPLAEPAMPLQGVFGYKDPTHVLENFPFEPGHFSREFVPEAQPDSAGDAK